MEHRSQDEKKLSELTGYTAYKVQFQECVHQCADDTAEKPVCSKCGKALVVKITATASDGKTKRPGSRWTAPSKTGTAM